MHSKATYGIYTFLFLNRKAMELAFHQYNFDKDDRAAFDAKTFEVEVVNRFGDRNTLICLTTRRREGTSMGKKVISGRWWRVCATAIWRQDVLESNATVSKFNGSEMAVAGLDAGQVFAQIREAVQAAPLHSGHFVDARMENRIDMQTVNLILEESADFVVADTADSYRKASHLIECLMTALNVPVDEPVIQQMAGQPGTRLRDAVRYLRTVKFTLLRDPNVPFNNYMRSFFNARTEEPASRALLEDELGGVASTRPASRTEQEYQDVLSWALAFAHRHHCCLDGVPLEHICNKGTLGDLFAALIAPKPFLYTEWLTKEITPGYVGRDMMTGAWYMLVGLPSAETVERKVTIQDSNHYNPRGVQIAIPGSCSYVRCLDEQDAHAKLAEHYAAQIKG